MHGLALICTYVMFPFFEFIMAIQHIQTIFIYIC